MTSEKSPDAVQMDAYEVSLADILAFLQRHLKIIISLAVLGAVLGVAITFALQKQWEGKVTLQVGRAAGSPVVGPDGPLIESLQQTVGRIQLNAFRDKVAAEVLPPLRGNVDELRKSVVWKALKARTVQGTAYFEITARGTSPEQAEQALNAASHLIQVEHAAILERARALPKQQLSVIDAAIEANTQAQQALSKALANSKNSDSVMALSALQSSRTERASLNESRFRAAQMLAPDQSYNTRIISDVQVEQTPAFPRKSFFGAGGLILGALLGVLIGFRHTRSANARR